jgi:N-acetylglucosaminyldiphosphoundecaprenol N-acetyl-beta-D-mannosaminyltransferase
MAPFPDYVDILGSHISRIDLRHAINLLDQFITDARKHVVVFPMSVHPVLLARKDPELRRIYNYCDLAPADGVPLLWAAKLSGKSIPGRVTGLDLLPAFCEVAAEKGYTFFFMGGKNGVAETLKQKLQSQYRKLRVVGVLSPPFRDEFTEEENREIRGLINRVSPDVLWVALTTPKQHRWIAKNIGNLDVRVAIAVGAAFDICAGLIPRAPKWMQTYGMEWFYRFLREPRRLFKRYFIELLPFFPLILLQRSKLIWSR